MHPLIKSNLSIIIKMKKPESHLNNNNSMNGALNVGNSELNRSSLQTREVAGF